MESKGLLFQMKQSSLFSSLTTKQLEKLISVSRVQNYVANQIITRENERAKEFFFVLEGEVEVIKTDDFAVQHRIAKIVVGEPIGELAMLTDSTYSATTKATEDSVLAVFPIERIKAGNKWKDIYDVLSHKLVNTLSNRLLRTSQIATESLSPEHQNMLARITYAKYFIDFIFFFCIYLLSMQYLFHLERMLWIGFFSTFIVSFLMMTFMFILMLRSRYPLSEFGITSKGWFKRTCKAVVYTIPVMLVIVICKWLYFWIYLRTNAPIFLFRDCFSSHNYSPRELGYYISLISYVMICLMQEIVIRCGLQTSLQRFFEGNRQYGTLYAILLSNLVFITTQMHKGVFLAIISFVPGLFLGWLFHKQRSIVSVSVAHIMVGIWGLYLVGIY